MQLKSRLTVLVVSALLAAATAGAQSSDPMVGTWKLNASKSKGTPFTSGTSVIEPAGDGIKATVDLADKDGTKHHWVFTAMYDGKENPVVGDSPFGDVVALTRTNPHEVRIDVKQGGKPTITQMMTVSADGKTRTITTTGTNAKGQAVNSTSVYEKQ